MSPEITARIDAYCASLAELARALDILHADLSELRDLVREPRRRPRPQNMEVAMTFGQCDLCNRHTTRLHSFVACGLEGAGCDQCTNYDWKAYDEPRAQYLDEWIDWQEEQAA